MDIGASTKWLDIYEIRHDHTQFPILYTDEMMDSKVRACCFVSSYNAACIFMLRYCNMLT